MGGKGGQGGSSDIATAGNGGDGGVGVQFTAAGPVRFSNTSSITGGNGGAGGTTTSGTAGSAGLGGAGIVGANLTIINSGTITGGMSGDTTNKVQADAIDFTGGTNNSLTLNTSTANGGLTGGLGLGGTVTIDPGASTTLTSVLHDYGTVTGSLAKIGTGSLTLGATNTYTGGTTLNGGTLELAAQGAAGSVVQGNAASGGVAFGAMGTTLQIDGAAFSAQFPLQVAFRRLDAAPTVETYASPITNFAPGETLYLHDLAYSGTVTATAIYTNNILSVTNGSTTQNLTDFTLANGATPPAGFTFTTSADASGTGTDVRLTAAPTITGTHATPDAAEAKVAPFGAYGASPAVTISDLNTGATDTLTITLSGGGGALTDGSTFKGTSTLKQTVAGAQGTYTLTGLASDITTELDALSFTPINTTPGAPALTNFALTDVSNVGGSSGSDTGTAVTDQSAPGAPSSPRLTVATDSGISHIDEVTNVVRPTFTGTAQAGATVTVYDNEVPIGTQTLTGIDTTYTIAATSDLAQGAGNSITARQTFANVQGAESGATAVTLDTVPPTITGATESGNGIGPNGNGDVPAGTVVTITVATDELVYVTPAANGSTPTLVFNNGGVATYTGPTGTGTDSLTFSYIVQKGQDTKGLELADITGSDDVTDQAGNPIDLASLATAAKPSGTLTIDTTAPVASSVTDTVAQSSGATAIGLTAPSDNLTPAGSLAIAVGTLPNDGTVTLSDGTTAVTAGEMLTAAQLTGLDFIPTPGVSSQGSTLTYSVTDGAGNATTGTAALNVGAAGAPTITGTHASMTTSEAVVTPFSGVTIADPSATSGATDTVTIVLTGAGGALTGTGLTRNADGSYGLAAASPATVTAEIDALSFTPTAGAAGTTSTTTFVLTDASSTGTSVTDAGTSVADTAAPAPAPTPIPVAPGSGGVVGVTPADTVSLSPQVTYRDGVFTLSGKATSAAGVAGVEITATVGGKVQDLGPAAVAADGSFTFQDAAGPRVQGFITATETDKAGVKTSAQADYSLTGGLDVGTYTARETSYTADGSAVTSRSLFRDTGQRAVDVEQAGQTFQSDHLDRWNNHGAPETTFVFTPGYGQDVVSLFRVDNTDHDTLSFKGSDFGNSIAEVLANTQFQKGGAVITDPTTKETVQLLGITKAQLTANQGDFTFHA